MIEYFSALMSSGLSKLPDVRKVAPTPMIHIKCLKSINLVYVLSLIPEALLIFWTTLSTPYNKLIIFKLF